MHFQFFDQINYINVNIRRKSIDKSNISLFGLLNNDNFGSSFCCNLVGENNNWGTFFTIDVYFFFLY